MKTYSRNEIEGFLEAIDENLAHPFTLIVIGGTAAALAYHVKRYTKDIDTVGSVDRIKATYNKAVAKTGLHIPLGPAGVEDGPYEYESRLVTLKLDGLRKLTIQVPEKHDLSLMKIVRGQEHDLQTIDEIHRNNTLSRDRLIELMRDEMTHVHGRKKEILLNFLAMIEMLFGETSARAAEKTLKNWSR